MALELRFSREAATDLDSILDYVEHDNPAAARALADRFDKSLSLLTELPNMGRAAREAGQDGMRRLSVPPYILYYRIGADTVEIVRVLHSSRLLDDPSLFTH